MPPAYRLGTFNDKERIHGNPRLYVHHRHQAGPDHRRRLHRGLGQRVHKPVVITKVFDKASPLLLAALTSGERLTKVEIKWYRTSAAGTQEHYYT
ncbi:type VI secretion system tube protein TssD, partial [Escherichia coli]|uniref:type VI secretion system tube protein TssD n=1 Tax=Escherichia coli TaxID=562 RepID=UPI003D9CA31D